MRCAKSTAAHTWRKSRRRAAAGSARRPRATAAAPTHVSGLLYGGGPTQLGKQLLGAGAVGLYAFVLSGALGLAIQRTLGFRLSPDDEVLGVDQVAHAETAYDLTPMTHGRATGFGSGGHGLLGNLLHRDEEGVS